LQRLEDLRQAVGADEPYVVVTDFEKALKGALHDVWPGVQQQICICHINKNVVHEVKKRWQWAPGMGPEEADYDVDEADDHVDPIFRDLVAVARAELPALSMGTLPEKVPDSPEGFLELWKHVCYSVTADDFGAAWIRILRDFSQQEGVIAYIQKTYLPLREQWAECYIRHYRNFGVKVTSRTEGSHKEIKSYLRNTFADLLFLAEKVEQLIMDREHQYTSDEATEAQRIVRDYQKMEWLGDMRSKLTRKAISLLVKQHDKLLDALRCNLGPVNALPACTNAFTKQFGLPCGYRIQEVISRNESLDYSMAHKYWYLGYDRVRDADPRRDIC
jgi:hypothetical protein